MRIVLKRSRNVKNATFVKIN